MTLVFRQSCNRVLKSILSLQDVVVIDHYLLHFSIKKVMTYFLIGFIDTRILSFWVSRVTFWFCEGVGIVEISLLFPTLLCSQYTFQGLPYLFLSNFLCLLFTFFLRVYQTMAFIVLARRSIKTENRTSVHVVTSYFPAERPGFLRGVIIQVLWSRQIVFSDFFEHSICLGGWLV